MTTPSRKTHPPPDGPGHAYADSTRGPRLQKVMAEAGVGSRRACEVLIEAGVVTVNGQVVRTLPAWVDPRQDRIVIDGKPLPRADRQVYVMLYKPRGVVCTNQPGEPRQRAIDLVRHPSKARLFPVGRLDMDSSGLLLLTNDGALANRLTHPRFHLAKVYEVIIRGSLDGGAIEKLERGLFLPDHRRGGGKRTARSRLHLLRRDRDRTKLRMELREGRNRQIRRMFLRLGCPVKRLRRVQIGPLKLRGVRPGEWRELTGQELAALKRAAGRTARDRSP